MKRDADREKNGEEKKDFLISRVNSAVKDGFTGIIRFEINLNQGGIRTIKSSVEELKKF